MKNQINIFSILLLASLFIISCSKKEQQLQNETQNIKDMDGWYTGDGKEGEYGIGPETEKYNGMPVYYLRSKGKTENKSADKFGTIIKNFPPAEYLGKRIKLSGYIKSDKVYGSAGMWLRIDGGNSNESTWGKTLEFDNMQNRPIKETTDWKKYEIVSDVPKESRMLFYGALLSGTGEIWISGLKFDTVGTNIPPTTFIPQKPYNP